MNDVWVAALSLVREAVLVTNDKKRGPGVRPSPIAFVSYYLLLDLPNVCT